MAVGELVSYRQDQRHRPLDDLARRQDADARQERELVGWEQFDTGAEHVECHGVVGDSAFRRSAR
jgi:hypothetical protein